MRRSEAVIGRPEWYGGPKLFGNVEWRIVNGHGRVSYSRRWPHAGKSLAVRMALKLNRTSPLAAPHIPMLFRLRAV